MTGHFGKTVAFATLYLAVQFAALYLLAGKLVTGLFAQP